MVSGDGLDAHLVVYVHDELFTARGKHHIRLGLVSSLASEEIPLLLHPLYLVVEFSIVSIYCIGGDDVVVEDVGWAHHSGVLNQSREVFPAQQAEDAIGEATMTPSIIHNRPRPLPIRPNQRPPVPKYGTLRETHGTSQVDAPRT